MRQRFWKNGLYPYRVTLQLEKIIAPSDRVSVSQHDLRDILFKHHSPSYGLTLVLPAKTLHDPVADYLLEILHNATAWKNSLSNLLLAIFPGNSPRS